MNSSPDIYENGRPELVEWELFQIVLDLTFLKERIPTKKQNQIFYWWVLSLGEIKFVDWKSGGGKWKWYWFDKYGADRPRWCAIIVNCSNYWTAIAGFFHRPVRKKGQLERVSKVLRLPRHICTPLLDVDICVLFIYIRAPLFIIQYWLAHFHTWRLTHWRLAVQKMHCGRVYEVECCNWWICQKCSADI